MIGIKSGFLRFLPVFLLPAFRRAARPSAPRHAPAMRPTPQSLILP
jgi:hypothetical protein